MKYKSVKNQPGMKNRAPNDGGLMNRKHVIIELLDAITMPYQSDVLCQEEHIRTYFPDPRSSPRFSISPTCITSLFF